jgi:hypothetical protein
MIGNMKLYYLVERDEDDRDEVRAVSGPFYTWNDAHDAKRKAGADRYLLEIAEEIHHVRVL